MDDQFTQKFDSLKLQKISSRMVFPFFSFIFWRTSRSPECTAGSAGPLDEEEERPRSRAWLRVTAAAMYDLKVLTAKLDCILSSFYLFLFYQQFRQNLIEFCLIRQTTTIPNEVQRSNGKDATEETTRKAACGTNSKTDRCPGQRMLREYGTDVQ